MAPLPLGDSHYEDSEAAVVERMWASPREGPVVVTVSLTEGMASRSITATRA